MTQVVRQSDRFVPHDTKLCAVEATVALAPRLALGAIEISPSLPGG